MKFTAFFVLMASFILGATAMAEVQIPLCKGIQEISVPAEMQGIYGYDGFKIFVAENGVTRVESKETFVVDASRSVSRINNLCLKQSLSTKNGVTKLKYSMVQVEMDWIFAKAYDGFTLKYNANQQAARIRFFSGVYGLALWIVPGGNGYWMDYSPIPKLQ